MKPFELLGKDSNSHEVYYPMNMNNGNSGGKHLFYKNNSTKAWELKLVTQVPTVDVTTGVVSFSLAPAVAVIEQDTTLDSTNYDYPWLVKRWNLPGSYTQALKNYPIFKLNLLYLMKVQYLKV